MMMIMMLIMLILLFMMLFVIAYCSWLGKQNCAGSDDKILFMPWPPFSYQLLTYIHLANTAAEDPKVYSLITQSW